MSKCKIRNLRENPFALYSAEEEIEILREIYFEPKYYRELMDNAINGSSRILVGQRGLGKSSTIHFLFKDLSNNSTLPLLITRYDGIPLTKNENYFLYKILQSLANGLAKLMFTNPKARKYLNSTQKKRMAFFLELFYDKDTARDYYENAKEIKRKKRLYLLCSFYNKSLKAINLILDGLSKFGTDLIRRSIGLDSSDIQDAVKEYFHEVNLPEIKVASIDEVVSFGRDRLKEMLDQMIEISYSLGYHSIVVLFDKIDEFKDVNSEVEKVADFAKDILQDTDLLYTKHLSIVFSLWSEVKRSLNKNNVRFDKFKDINIEWRIDDLEKLINKRLAYFSKDKTIPVTLETLLPLESDRLQILSLADSSPRSLIRLLSELYYQEEAEDVICFSPLAITKGTMQFCVKFDYCSLQAMKIGGKGDLYSWINKVLQIKRHIFTYNDVIDTFSMKKDTNAVKYVNDMLRLELVRELIPLDDQEERTFEVVDPRLKYLISRGITELL